MRFRSLLGLAPLVLALACGGADSAFEQIHEKEGADEAAVLSGWEIERAQQQSTHPLANNLDEVTEVEAPDTARKFRLRFARIDMEHGYDELVVEDEWGTEIERITGRHRNYVTRTIQGKKAKIRLVTDSSLQSWGYRLDEIRHRGCSHNAPADPSLASVSSCSALERGIRDLAVKEVRRRFSEGHFGGPIIFRANGGLESAAAAPAHSETNTQVRGVDEADIVKTDGNFIYQVAGRQLRIFSSYPAQNAQLLHSVDIEGYPKELFADSGKLIVMSGVQGDGYFPGPGPIPLLRLMPMWWRPDAFTKVTVIDFDGTNAPTIASETLLAGQYNTARKVGQSVRVVLRRQLDWPNIQYYPGGEVEWNSRAWDEAMDQLEADAVQAVMDRDLEDWLPTSYRIVNGNRVEIPVDCSDFFLPSDNEEMGLTTVATLRVWRSTPTVQETSMLVNGGEVYQSLDNLYLSTPHRWSCYEDAGTEGQYTYFHKVDVSHATSTSYEASGGVPGAIGDQFSMDEYNGYLRVATTNQRWQAETPEERSVSGVYVLGQSGTDLDVVGSVEGIAPSERIFGVRFLGPKGFVVTYRQVDPLFTLNLQDPTNPTIAGELKIPGFSTYLHPLTDDTLFTIGQDFETDGTTRNGVALSIFDVSNLAQPRLVHKAVIGTTHGYSEALYDHKAFTMYKEPGASDWVLAIPFTDYGETTGSNFWGSFKSTLKVFRVSRLGIIGLGELDHTDLYQQNQNNDFGWWYMPNVRRGVFVDDTVFAVSDSGVKVAPINDLTNILATVHAPPQYQLPQPTNPVITVDASATPLVSIPDADPNGVSSSVRISDDVEIQAVTVQVNVTHSYRGDLVVKIEHDGIEEVLHDRTGGSTNNLVKTFTLEDFDGLNAKGDWTLTVSDNASWDTGELVEWSLSVTGEEM